MYARRMLVELPLDKMSVEEKLDLMEVLWEDLSRTPDEIPSPAWHKEVLDECLRRAESGEEKFLNFEDVKKDLLRRFS